MSCLFLKVIIQTKAFKELSKNPPVRSFAQHSICNTPANGKADVEERTCCCQAEQGFKGDCHLRLWCQQ